MKPSPALPVILVTGASGQLGSELKGLEQKYRDYCFYFFSKNELSITDTESLNKFFDTHPLNYCINCAAYTAVDKAESDEQTAYFINHTAVANLAQVCKKHKVKLIHISTDYVYGDCKNEPLKETDLTGPVNVYGRSKLQGEEAVLSANSENLIIRTSWLYSAYGHNFVKTMIRLLSEKTELSVVDDQQGSPTHAADLADAILKIIRIDSKEKKICGILNYANTGITTWYQFAKEIQEIAGTHCKIHPVTTENYPTPAKRPKYSVLDTTRISSILKTKIPFWKDSLKDCLTQIKKEL